MKIAIPTKGEYVSEHFGYCEEFTIFNVVDNEVQQSSTLKNSSDHQPGALPKLLKDKQVDVVLAGGIGSHAITLFNDMGIKVITGASGHIEDVLNEYLKGHLQNQANICHHDE